MQLDSKNKGKGRRNAAGQNAPDIDTQAQHSKCVENWNNNKPRSQRVTTTKHASRTYANHACTSFEIVRALVNLKSCIQSCMSTIQGEGSRTLTCLLPKIAVVQKA